MSRKITKKACWDFQDMEEKFFRKLIIQVATAAGWMVHSNKTDVRNTGHGFPDLVLMQYSTGRIIAAELKRNDLRNSRLRSEQQHWLVALDLAGLETYVWRPRDRDKILEILEASSEFLLMPGQSPPSHPKHADQYDAEPDVE